MEEQYYHFISNNGQIDAYFHKDPADKDKYIVCTCARGENDYLVEYVEHYLNLDFDKIIICDNNDDDSVEKVLQKYIEDGTVEIFNCRGFDSFQVQFYSMFCTEGNYKWCAYFDADEFLELGVYTSIKLFLETIPAEDDSVSFNWLVYGTNGIKHKTPGRIQDRFKEPVRPVVMFKENVFVKSILRGGPRRFENCWFNGSHIPMCSNDVRYNIGGSHISKTAVHTYSPVRYKCGYLKHYYTKTFDEWIKKASRGWPDGTPTLTGSNFMLCDNHSNYPIDNFIDAFFISPSASGNFGERMYPMLDEYDVIQVTNSSQQVYALTTQLMSMMKSTTNHTFVLTDDHIDDTLFAIFLEYAIITGNRIVFARDAREMWLTFLRYSQKDNYYILDLR